MIRSYIKKALFFIIFLIVAFFFISNRFINFTPGGSLERASSYFIYPVLYMQKAVITPIKEYFQRKKNVEELRAELHAVQIERDMALAENIQLHTMVDYDQHIAELANFKKRYLTDSARIVHIIAKNFSEQAHYFLIDAGERKGVKPDMVAIYNNCLVGKVVEVYPLYSKVLLITDKNCKVAGMCVKTKINGIYEGTNDTNGAQLNHVSHLLKVAHGDLLVSNGEGLVFPKGFGLGKVKSYHVNGLFYQIAIEPLLDLKTVNYCTLIERDGNVFSAIPA